MAEINERLAHIRKLAHRLVEKLEEERQGRARAEEQVKELTDQISEKNHRLTVLERELEMAKVARGLTSKNEDSGLAKARINSLVREIDRCIAMLNE